MESNNYAEAPEGSIVYPSELHQRLIAAFTVNGIEAISQGDPHQPWQTDYVWQVALQSVIARLGRRGDQLATVSRTDMVTNLLSLGMATPEPGTGIVHLFYPTAEAVEYLYNSGAEEAAIYTDAAATYVAMMSELGFPPRYKVA